MERMQSKQMIFTMALFIFGSSIIVGVSTDAGQDSWISLILAMVLIIPVILIYSRIMKLNPKESLFDISEKLFGKIIGKIITVLMTWYAIHLGTLVVVNFTKFINISSLPSTPEIIVAAILIFITVYMIKSPVSTFGKWSSVLLPAIIVILIIIMIISIPNMHINHITPVMSHSFGTIFYGAIKNFAFPFAETVLFLCLGSYIKKEDSPYKIYFSGIALGGIFLLIVFLRNLLILGANTLTNAYFPSYLAVRVIQVGDFFSRIEGILMVNYLLSGITKISICLLVVSKGLSKLINSDNHRDLSIPAGLIILGLSGILYQNMLQMYDFLDVYFIYAAPFQLIIPIVIWIASELKSRKNKVLA
jgi:spore germination protein KB